MSKKRINFASHLAPFILDGSKFLTYRLDPKYYDYMVGENVELYDKAANKKICDATITDKYEIEYKDLTHNAKGHETYESKDSMTAEFEKYYPIKMSDETKVLVLKFEKTA